jgi:hypothetical protein
MGELVLKRASASRLSGEWSDNDYDTLAEDSCRPHHVKAAGRRAAARVEA